MTPRQTAAAEALAGRGRPTSRRARRSPVTAPSGESRPRLSGASRWRTSCSGCGGWATTCRPAASVTCSIRCGRSTCSHLELPVGSVGDDDLVEARRGPRPSRTADRASWSPAVPSTSRPAARIRSVAVSMRRSAASRPSRPAAGAGTSSVKWQRSRAAPLAQGVDQLDRVGCDVGRRRGSRTARPSPFSGTPEATCSASNVTRSARVQGQRRLQADRRPAQGARRAGRGHRRRRPLPDAARRHRARARRPRWPSRSRSCSGRRW